MRMSEIAEKIVKKYPECCMAYNKTVKDGCREDWYEEMLINEVMSFYYYEKMDLCGCGNPELTIKAIYEMLKIQSDFHNNKINNPYKEREIAFGESELCIGTSQFMMYQLDNLGFLEHGSSIGGAWLTDDGKELLKVMDIWLNYDGRDI